MRNYFIYQYDDLVSSKNKLKVTVIFVAQEKILSQNTLAEEINTFFQQNSITDKFVVVLPKYMEAESLMFFTDDKDKTFFRVPGKSQDYFDKSLLIYQFNNNGDLELIFGTKPKNEKRFILQLLRSGSTIIFKNNGGLVESTSDHHFVFPSKKHCSKFIRTGNVLINQTEIFFLAIQLLTHITNKNTIYCDTSSINVLPYAVFELLRRFNLSFNSPIINSFESYELFETFDDTFSPDSLILISSSTSGNIIDRILKEKRADKSQIQVIFFLGPPEKYSNHSSNIICNLTKEDDFILGIPQSETFDSASTCKLCVDHSRPIPIRSDVFLTVQPKIEKHLLSTKQEYCPTYVSSFLEDFRGYSLHESIIKVFFKDNDANADYEIYFDFVRLIKNIDEDKFEKFRESLNRHIDKSVPANTKYILHLPDNGSKELAEYIVKKIPNIKPQVIKLDKEFINKISKDAGTLVIVASCITTGKKLLQISRLMRKHENVSLVYFVGIFRPISETFSKDLISDLKKGKDKSDDRPFIVVEKINCSIQQKDTSWKAEIVFFENLLGSILEINNKVLFDFVNKRLEVLRDNKKTRGLSDNVFLNQYNDKKLFLRKNFALWNFTDYTVNDVAQSEVYFTISALLTNLENKEINCPPSLRQTNYVRNIISPRNFHRFNDGIIQASLLRSGKPQYFSYDLDEESNLTMKEFLLTIIENYNTEDGEALLEFLLAIGIKKLKLKKEDLKEVLVKAKQCDNELISGMSEFIFRQLT